MNADVYYVHLLMHGWNQFNRNLCSDILHWWFFSAVLCWRGFAALLPAFGFKSGDILGQVMVFSFCDYYSAFGISCQLSPEWESSFFSVFCFTNVHSQCIYKCLSYTFCTHAASHQSSPKSVLPSQHDAVTVLNSKFTSSHQSAFYVCCSSVFISLDASRDFVSNGCSM